jgi:hypothetical protein
MIGSWLTAVGFGCSSRPYLLGHGKCTSWPKRLQGIAMERMRQSCRHQSATDFCVAGWKASINHGDSGGPVMLESGGHWVLEGLVDLLVSDTVDDDTPPFFDDMTSIAEERAWIDNVVGSLATHHCGTTGSSAGSGYTDIRAHGIDCAAALRLLDTWSPITNQGWTLTHQSNGYDRFSKASMWITGMPLGD